MPEARPTIHLGKRFQRLVERVLSHSRFLFYSKLYVEPYIKRHYRPGRIAHRTFAFNSISIICETRFFKVALNHKSTVAREFSNFQLAIEKHRQLSSLMPKLEIFEIRGLPAISMPRLYPMDQHLALECGLSAYKKNLDSATQYKKQKLSDNNNWEHGLEIIREVYGEPLSGNIRSTLNAWLDKGNYHLGFAHGDFHWKNILLDHSGLPKLIDFDCLRIQGIQEFDALYFAFEMEFSSTGVPWHITIGDYIENTLSSNSNSILMRFGVGHDPILGIAFLIDRMGQEAALYNFRYHPSQLERAIEAIKKSL